MAEATAARARARSTEAVGYVNDDRYQALFALYRDIRKPGPSWTAASAEIGSLLFEECRLLDERAYDEWLALFSQECLYWVPNRYDAGDPRIESAIYLDDRRRMVDRVELIRTGHLHAQTPPSRTRRNLTNLCQRSGPAGRLLALANVVIWDYRKGVHTAHPGWQAYELEPAGAPTGGGWRILNKIVLLLDCDAPQGNYTFLL